MISTYQNFFLESCAYEQNVEYCGNDVAIKTATDETNCQKLCQHNAECNFWSFDRTDQVPVCWMKSSDSGRRSSAHFQWVSGPKFCSKF